jgi:hypothetical protein
MNRIRNSFSDVQVKYLMDNFDDAVRNQTEDYWRKTIAEQIYDACPSVNKSGYPCEDCYEFYEFVRYRKETSHDG